MIRHGIPPYLECSSKGDKRFSAFYAKVNGKSIESQYQAAKIFEDGSTNLNWKQAKGRLAINQLEVNILYENLWRHYINENPNLQRILIDVNGLSDIFGQVGHICQASVLWKIRNELIGGKNEKK